jgi:uridine kinase
MTRTRLLAALARRIGRVDALHPVRVAIDGVDAAGKTTLADELVEPVRALGRPVIRASIDDFHHPAAVRYRVGRHSAEGYFRDSFDLEAVRARLLGPLGPGGDRRFQPKAFDYKTDSRVEAPEQTAAINAVLLFDGIFLQRPELREAFELTIFLDVPFGITVARMVTRDGGPADVEDAGNHRYVGGQRIYLRECEPRKRADLVVDNRDWDEPRIARGELEA